MRTHVRALLLALLALLSAPALLAAGDRVRWQAITRAEFDMLEAASAAGTLARERFLCAEDDGGKEAADVRSA